MDVGFCCFFLVYWWLSSNNCLWILGLIPSQDFVIMCLHYTHTCCVFIYNLQRKIMYHNGSRLSEIVTYSGHNEQGNESEPVPERQITPVPSWVQGHHPKTVTPLFLRIPQTNLESSIHQSHVIVMWEEAGGTRKLCTEKSPAPGGLEPRTFSLCPDSANQLVKPANRMCVCLLGVHHLTCHSSTQTLTCDASVAF